MTDSTNAAHRAKRRRLVPVLWVAGAAAATLLGLTVSGTISGFQATITNNNDTVSTGTLALQESGPGSAGTTVNCTDMGSGSNCSTINKWGSTGATVTTLTPGQTVTTTVTLKNTGTTAASIFTLTPGLCTSSPTASASVGNLCDQLKISITGDLTVTSQTPNQMNTTGALTITGGLPAGATKTFTFSVNLPAGSNNTFQGLTATQNLAWQIST